MRSEQPPGENTERKGLSHETEREHSESALRALLGLPSGGNQPAPDLTASSVQLRFMQSPLSALKKNDEESGEDEEHFKLTGNAVPNTVESHRGHASDAAPGPSSNPPQTQHPEAVATAKKENSARASAEHDAPAKKFVLQQTSIAIPGVSMRRQDFPQKYESPNLSPENISNPLPPASMKPSASLKTQSRQEAVPEPDQQSSHIASPPLTPEVAAPDAAMLTRLERRIVAAEAARKSEARAISEPSRAADRRTSLTDNNEARKPVPSYPPTGLSGQASVNDLGRTRDRGVERANTDLAQRLARLERTVSELAAKAASRPVYNRHETQRRQPMSPLPRPPVVNVKRTAPAPAGPRAFWERSYLSRWHLRFPR